MNIDTIPLPASLTLGSVEGTLSSIPPSAEWRTLDFSLVRFARSDALLLLLAFSAKRHKNSDGLWLIPPKDQRVLKYLVEAGFFRLLATARLFANAEEMPRAPSNRVSFNYIPTCKNPSSELELGRFESDFSSFLNWTIKNLGPDLAGLGLASRDIDELWHATKEIYENVYRHSGAWGSAVVQLVRGQCPSVLSSCVDTGIGIRESLAPVLKADRERISQQWTDAAAILEAVKDRVSRLQASADSWGYGLGICLKFTARYGWLYIRSNSASVLFRGGKSAVRQVHPIPGTLVVLEMGPLAD